MLYDVVLFDLDGTITESEPGITKSVQYALERLGVDPPPQSALRGFIGPPLFPSFVRAGLSEADAGRAVALYRERFSTIGWRENAVYPGIPRLLRSLKRGGAYVALATAKPQPFAERIAEHFGFAGLLDRIEGSDLSERHADKREIVARALRGASGRAVMVGDKASDLAAAAGNGIDGVGVRYGYALPGELEGQRSTAIVDDVARLSALLMGGAALSPGFFVTFEGQDGCGKTTQLDAAAGWLRERGYPVIVTREPGGTPIAERIRELVLHSGGMTAACEALLFAAARAEHLAGVVRPGVANGAVVLSDRHVDSSIAYQGAGRQLGMDLVRRINAPAVGDTRPDRTLWFDVDPALAAARREEAGGLDRLEREGAAFQDRVYNGFRRLAQDEPDRIRRVDAARPIDEVRDQVLIALTELIGRA
ncbi:MAG: dTMP kinase [Clostridiales bacterium]|nr:dTMP kinase [Clostridiales bacterium]